MLILPRNFSRYPHVFDCDHLTSESDTHLLKVIFRGYEWTFTLCKKCSEDKDNKIMRSWNFIKLMNMGVKHTTCDCGHLQNGNDIKAFIYTHPSDSYFIYIICGDCDADTVERSKHKSIVNQMLRDGDKFHLHDDKIRSHETYEKGKEANDALARIHGQLYQKHRKQARETKLKRKADDTELFK
jgi:hypothetical protein